MGARPLITHVDAVDDTRIELSATTFANWVDKTVNLVDGLGVGAGEPILLEVAAERPDHWVSLVWALAAWQFGSPVALTPSSDVALAVIGPADVRPRPGVDTVACSLHPWGLGFESVPKGVSDYRDVLAEPDAHWTNPPPDRPFTTLSWDDLVVPPIADRVLVANPDDVVALLAALGGVLAGGGSLVVVHGNADVPRIAASERATPL